eukprot:40643_1
MSRMFYKRSACVRSHDSHQTIDIIKQCYKLREFSCETNWKRMNCTEKKRLNTNLDIRRAQNGKTRSNCFAMLPLKGSYEFQTIRQQIFRCQEGREIRTLIKSLKKDDDIELDQSVYTAGITKCGELGDIYNACNIMKLMRKHKVKRNINCYNILFRAMALNEKVYEYPKYLQYLVDKEKLKPDIITAGILIGGCKARGAMQMAEQIWKDIIVAFELQPTQITFIQMLSVYAKGADKDKAQRTFKEMMEAGIQPCQSSCGALMECFAKCLDIESALKIKQFMELKGVAVGSHQYRSLMSCYLKHKMPLKALQVYDEYENSLQSDDIPANAIIGMKNTAFLVMLEENVNQNINESTTNHYYQMVTKGNVDEMRRLYGNKSAVLQSCGNHVLQAHVLYHDVLKKDEKKTVQLFCKVCEDYNIGYWVKCRKTGGWMIDFHSFGYVVAKFVLKYLFKYEKRNILEMEDVLILCGKGYHRDKYANADTQKQQRGIMYFVQHQIARWSPPIRSQRCNQNHAVLRLAKEDVMAWFEAQHKSQEHAISD